MLTDTRLWPIWGPSICKVESSDDIIRLGSSGKIRTTIGLTVPFLIDRFEPGAYWSWKIGPVRATGHRIRPIANECTLVAFEVPLWAPFYLLVCLSAFHRMALLGNHPLLRLKESGAGTPDSIPL